MKIADKLVLVTFTLLCLTTFATTFAQAADDKYESLEQFCNATNSDTPENCACGQAKADELLTTEEQQLVIGMMMQDPAAMGKFTELGNAAAQELMAKVEEITQGCS